MIFTNLTRNFRRIIAPDLIGFGFSDKPVTKQPHLIPVILINCNVILFLAILYVLSSRSNRINHQSHSNAQPKEGSHSLT